MTTEDWNLVRVGAYDAWKILTPSGEPQDIDWQGVEVAHLDTGYTRHPVFSRRADATTWLRPDDGVNYREMGKLPIDPANYGGFPGHGTRTLSVLCGDLAEDGRTRDPKTRMGVAPGLPVIPYRVTDTVVLLAGEPRRNISLAIRDAVFMKGADVISASLGFPTLVPPFVWKRYMGRAVDEAYERGVIFVAAGGQPADTVAYPGKFWRTIGVGGIRADGSNYQPYEDSMYQFIDVFGPADEIIRADAVKEAGPTRYTKGISNDDPDAQMNSSSGSSSSGSGGSGTGKGDGTSYATVHVAAAAAMWLRHRADEIDRTYDQTNRWQIVEAFRHVLQSTAELDTHPSLPAGKGVLQIPALLNAPLPPPSSLTRMPSATGQFF